VKENIIEFPNRSVVSDEAAMWLVRLDSDRPLSAQEQVDLRKWLQQSPQHSQELNELAALWGRMNVLTELAVPLEKPLTALARARVCEPEREWFVRGLGWAAVAAAVVILGLAVILTTWQRQIPWDAGNGLYATAVGHQRRVTLTDGSIVLLNTNSRIRVEYSTKYRNVYLLQGEAYFEVAKNAAQPFRVYAGNGRVQAVGTAFSVYLKNNAVDVTVTEGRVALASLDAPAVAETGRAGTRAAAGAGPVDGAPVKDLVMLDAGQSTTIREADEDAADDMGGIDEIETVDRQEMNKRLSWQRGLLTFAGDPLEKVVKEISRYTTLSIEITDPGVRAIKIGGQFPVGETDAMLDALEVNFGLRVTRLDDNHVHLAAAGGSK